MPAIHEQRTMPYSAEQMFDLVADVARYAEFLPWVAATRVRSDDGREMIADMLVGFKSLREKFTSKVDKVRPDEIRVHYLDGPMRDLDNVWQFRALDDGSCEVDFSVPSVFAIRYSKSWPVNMSTRLSARWLPPLSCAPQRSMATAVRARPASPEAGPLRD
jgi:coenzyme Q-binding protein COQ10